MPRTRFSRRESGEVRRRQREARSAGTVPNSTEAAAVDLAAALSDDGAPHLAKPSAGGSGCRRTVPRSTTPQSTTAPLRDAVGSRYRPKRKPRSVAKRSGSWAGYRELSSAPTTTDHLQCYTNPGLGKASPPGHPDFLPYLATENLLPGRLARAQPAPRPRGLSIENK